MSCCAPGLEHLAAAAGHRSDDAEVMLASRDAGDGLRLTELSVPGIHCGGCIQAIERALGLLPGVAQARVNLSTKRVAVRWRAADKPPRLFDALAQIGYSAHLNDAETDADDTALGELVRALAVAGFAAMNIMLLSVSIWSGAAAETRDLFHWISAAIALPALLYSGRIFFRSAWNALRCGQTNMDVPIAIGVLLAFGLSLYETIHRGQHAYFDAATSLLFFLLIGRTLDHMMRERARIAVKGLARLAPRGAMVLKPDGSRVYLPLAEIIPGATLLLAAGERVPVDGRVTQGRSDLDCSLVTGESAAQCVSAGASVQAGTLNLTGSLTMVATAAAADSFLAEMIRMMEAAESGRSLHRRIADRAARLYAPVVHAAALLTFAGWMLVEGDLHRALTIAIAVLIITCPCALGLAVPMVQVAAARRLFERGIMLKDGGALERLAEIDTVIFDKTGTLTLGKPRLAHQQAAFPEAPAIAAALAAHSRHPYSRALAAAHRHDTTCRFDRVSEHPGSGLEAPQGASVYRLGRASWALADQAPASAADGATMVLAKDGHLCATFRFDDQLRPDAHEAVAALKEQGHAIEILSGDRDAAVRSIGQSLGVPHAAEVLPGEKAARIAGLTAAGRKVLMVGDGLNDAPALSAAHASMAPASAADIGRNAADLVFLRESLTAVPHSIAVARRAAVLVRQNLTLAVGYNLIAVPIAVMGHVTPLVAAAAMSLSSVLVIANALRISPAKVAGRREAASMNPVKLVWAENPR